MQCTFACPGSSQQGQLILEKRLGLPFFFSNAELQNLTGDHLLRQHFQWVLTSDEML